MNIHEYLTRHPRQPTKRPIALNDLAWPSTVYSRQQQQQHTHARTMLHLHIWEIVKWALEYHSYGEEETHFRDFDARWLRDVWIWARSLSLSRQREMTNCDSLIAYNLKFMNGTAQRQKNLVSNSDRLREQITTRDTGVVCAHNYTPHVSSWDEKKRVQCTFPSVIYGTQKEWKNRGMGGGGEREHSMMLRCLRREKSRFRCMHHVNLILFEFDARYTCVWPLFDTLYVKLIRCTAHTHTLLYIEYSWTSQSTHHPHDCLWHELVQCD